MADGTGGPVEKGRTRADRLKDAIAESIVRGELPAGQRLDEVSVAQRFAVSRTPVREALKQLAAMDLVELRPHRGAVVAGLEPGGWQHCSRPWPRSRRSARGWRPSRCPMADREQLEILWARCDAVLLRSGDIEAVHETNQDFHAAIYKGAGNEFLADAAHALRRRLAPLSRAQFGLTGRTSDSATEHKAVMKAIRARDGAMADRAMRLHVASIRRAFERWLDAGGSRISA